CNKTGMVRHNHLPDERQEAGQGISRSEAALFQPIQVEVAETHHVACDEAFTRSKIFAASRSMLPNRFLVMPSSQVAIWAKRLANPSCSHNTRAAARGTSSRSRSTATKSSRT